MNNDLYRLEVAETGTNRLGAAVVNYSGKLWNIPLTMGLNTSGVTCDGVAADISDVPESVYNFALVNYEILLRNHILQR